MSEAFKVTVLNDGTTSNYGFGWNATPNGGAWHNGSWLGARTMIAINRTSKNGLVILDNSSSEQVDYMTGQLAKVLKD